MSDTKERATLIIGEITKYEEKTSSSSGNKYANLQIRRTYNYDNQEREERFNIFVGGKTLDRIEEKSSFKFEVGQKVEAECFVGASQSKKNAEWWFVDLKLQWITAADGIVDEGEEVVSEPDGDVGDEDSLPF